MVHSVLLFGPPFIGKGTQSKILQLCGYKSIETGEMFRKLNERPDIVEIMAAGGLVPDEDVLIMVDAAMRQHSPHQALLFDGFPRTLNQAEKLIEMLRERNTGRIATVHLHATKEVLIQRWHESLTIGDRGHRKDDEKEEVVIDRIARYDKYKDQVLPYLRDNTEYTSIDGQKSKLAVNHFVSKHLLGIDRLGRVPYIAPSSQQAAQLATNQ